MIAVFKNEFSSIFRRLYGYIIISLSMLASSVLFIAYNLAYSTENILSVISSMAIVTALLIPVMAVCMFPSKKKANTDAAYDILPLSSFDIVVGKYLASLASLMLPNMLVLIFPAISGLFGAVDHAVSFSALLGYVLFECAYLAFSMFFASLAKSRVRAYLWCYITAVIWYFSTFIEIFIPKKSVLVYFEEIMDSISIFEQLNLFIQGIFNLRGIVFFVLLTVVFLFLTWRNREKQYSDKKTVAALNFKSVLSLLTAIVVFASALIIPIAASFIPNNLVEFDSTQAKKNSLSAQAKNFLESVDKEVTIYLLEPTGLRDYELYLEKLAASSKKITLEEVYYSNTPEFYTERGINTSSISANSLVVESESATYYVAYSKMFYYSNTTLGIGEMTESDYSYYYSLFSSNEQYADYLEALVYDTSLYYDADRLICSYIEYATADILPKNYYLVGHGEQDINNSASPYYGLGLESLNISDGNIPADAASIFINAPSEDITKAEADALVDYLAKGGQITFVSVTDNLSMDNLCSVLKAYGMTAEQGIVYEEIESDEQDTSSEEESAVTSEYEATIHTDNDILYYLDGVSGFAPTVKNASSITVDAEIKDSMKLTVTELVSSSENSAIDNSGSKSTYTLSCAVEAPNGAKLSWLTGESYNDINDDAAYIVMYALSWVTLQFESTTENIPAVLYNAPIVDIDTGTANILSITLIIAPVAVLCLGVLVYVKRKKA